MVLDGTDIKYLLKKKDIELQYIASMFGYSSAFVSYVIHGTRNSKKIVIFIEQLLDMKPDSLEISKERMPALIKAA